MPKRVVLLGGSGQIGWALTARLLDAGWSVTIAHRGGHALPPHLLARGALSVEFDREKTGAVPQVLGSGADAVVDIIAYAENHASQLLEVQHNVEHFVVVSSASVYCDSAGRTLDEAGTNGFPELPIPIAETQLTVSPGPQTYSTRKVAIERTMLERSRVPVTVVRPCAIYGPGSTHPREWWFVKRALDGRRFVPLAYEGQSRFHPTSTANLAEIILVALEQRFTGILNAADFESPSVAEIGIMIGKAMNVQWTIVPLASGLANSSVGDTPWSVPRPIVLDTRAAAVLGYRPVTSYETALPALCKWLIEATAVSNWRDAFPVLARYPGNLFAYAAEDELLATMNVV